MLSNINPSEDYKTSILSGLSPTVIMECAGRGLAFYSYQATQEVYVTSEHTICPLLTVIQDLSGIHGEESDQQIWQPEFTA